MLQPLRRFSFSITPVFVLLTLSWSCTTATSQDELGEAYVAPATLTVRKEIVQKSGNMAVLKHGDRVSVIDVKRRFVKIRTSKHLEGWVDALQLLSADQMAALGKASQTAASLPSQGSASVFEPLNVHLEPFRQSPAFARIDEGAYVSVLSHRLTPKQAEPPKAPSLIHERPQPERRHRKGKAVRPANLPAPPPPPKPPANWQELSGHSGQPAQAKDHQAQDAAPAQKPVAYEDWTLVRTKDNQSGWVLSRNLVMGIPDEVAQFAEGKRITSYFDLGPVNDEEKGVKHNWLWTTASQQFDYDFDAWRVFLWNRRRHRYETSFRQRQVEGYYPVRVDPADANSFGRTFHVLTKDDDGKFRLRTYVFDSTRVHLTATEDALPNGSFPVSQAKALDTNRLEEKKPGVGSWWQRSWHAFKSHWPGHTATE